MPKNINKLGEPRRRRVQRTSLCGLREKCGFFKNRSGTYRKDRGGRGATGKL